LEKYEKLIASMKNRTNLLELVKMGYTSEQIKNDIVTKLSPYFEDKNALLDCALELIPAFASISRLESCPIYTKTILSCLDIFRSAKANNSESCFESMASYHSQINHSVSEYWSVFHLEIDKNTLGLDEFVHESFRNIGAIIEDLAKPYYKTILHQLEISKGNPVSFDEINVKDLGQIINELVKHPVLSSVLSPLPWKISISQWRNIAYHHTYRIQNNQILCEYGKKSKTQKITLDKNELLLVINSVFNTFCSFKIAHNFFLLQNAINISKYSNILLEERVEAGFVGFSAGLASQGFDIVEFKYCEDEAKAALRDTIDTSEQRRAHATQFLYLLWLFTKSKSVGIEYRTKDNTSIFLARISSEICQKVYDEELDILEIAKTFEVVHYKHQ
jgi:hypothetical protein